MDHDEIAGFYRAEGYWKHETLPGRLAAVCADAGEREAIIDGSNRVSFASFGALVERVAGHLSELGVGLGDVVSWQLPNWWEAAVVHHAALRVGAVPNPLNMIFRGRELRFVLDEAKPSLLIVPQIFRR